MYLNKLQVHEQMIYQINNQSLTLLSQALNSDSEIIETNKSNLQNKIIEEEDYNINNEKGINTNTNTNKININNNFINSKQLLLVDVLTQVVF